VAPTKEQARPRILRANVVNHTYWMHDDALTVAGASALNVNEWYVFDGVSQRGPMSRAEVIQLLKAFGHPEIASVWRPGLDGWKPATQLSDIVIPDRPADPPERDSCKSRYSLYGLYAGLAANLADYLFEWRGASFGSWEGAGLFSNLDLIAWTMTPCLAVAFVLGAIADAWRTRSFSILDPSTFHVPEVLPPHLSDRNRYNNFIARYWRGEYSLGASYWLVGLLAAIPYSLIVVALASAVKAVPSYDPKVIFYTIASIWILGALVLIWQSVGVWRSANRHIIRRRLIGKRSPWAVIAKLAQASGVLQLAAVFASSGWPQLVEVSRVAFLGDPDIPAYSIRVMRNGTEAEITGGFKYGLTDDLSKILTASRQIRVVHLDSEGGRFGEAVRLHGVLRAQGVDTYVASDCYSACTIAFAAGRNRIVRKGAKLGFHAPAFPGLSKDALDAASQEQKDIFVRSGFERSFVEKAISTPNSDIWTPSAKLMAKANVITRVSDGSDFAISGFGADISKESIGLSIAKEIPFLQSLKDRFPKKYDDIVDAYYDDFIAGKTETEANESADDAPSAMVAALRPLADDDVLVELGAAYADEFAALGAESPALCYRYASRIVASAELSGDLPSDLFSRAYDLN
jgi:GYF domain 2